MDMEIFTCGNCHYTFAGQSDCDQCPDCGKKQIRIATEPGTAGIPGTPEKSGIMELN